MELSSAMWPTARCLQGLQTRVLCSRLRKRCEIHGLAEQALKAVYDPTPQSQQAETLTVDA